MRWLYDKLKALGRWIKNKAKSNFVSRFIVRRYQASVERSARWVLPWCFNNQGARNRFFNTRFGMRTLRFVWGTAAALGILTYPVYDVLSWVVRKTAKVGLRLAQGVALLVATFWAVLSIAFTVLLSVFVWVINTLRHVTVSGWRYAWHRVAKGKHVARPKPITRYASMREVQAYYLGGLTTVHAGAAHLFRRLIGDRLCWLIIKQSSDMTARLHPATFDYWFGRQLPYGYNDDVEQYGMFITDHVVEEPISEKDKAEAFFRNAGYVLIATAPEGEKTEKEVFNEMVRERWADINAAEIGTDEWGRTWAIAKPGQPLVAQDVSTSAEQARLFADQEINWMAEKDPKARALGYGRHWIAALLDQDADVLSSDQRIKKERAMLFYKVRGGSLPVEHVMRGFDEFVKERQTAAESVSS